MLNIERILCDDPKNEPIEYPELLPPSWYRAWRTELMSIIERTGTHREHAEAEALAEIVEQMARST